MRAARGASGRSRDVSYIYFDVQRTILIQDDGGWRRGVGGAYVCDRVALEQKFNAD